ncbi:MAG: NADH-quinone oxidoreductase subunit NuoH [Planctomycetota bacterium]
MSLPIEVVWILKAGLIYAGLLTFAAGMTLAERKVAAWMQWRVGPNRVGPWGILQPVADGIKAFFKEELRPEGANRVLFRLAPALAAVPSMLTVAVIPFAGTLTMFGHRTTLSVIDVSVSAIVVVAIGGLSIYGVILGGWSSNSKYSLLGGLRASAQMVSYELALLLSILAVVVVSGSLDLRQVVAAQAGPIWEWNVWTQPLAFLLFVVATFAEANRHPFDFAECEPELVGGFHTEYSAMKFALFFLGEYCALVVLASLTTTLFLGGGEVPFWTGAPWFVQLAAFVAKMSIFLFLFLWVRWTLPRFRFDQLMALGWKVMLPLALANLFATGALASFGVYVRGS